MERLESWDALLQTKQLTEELLLADAADFGVGVWTHLRRNAERKLRSMRALTGVMKGRPAIVIGAGPSLREIGTLLSQFQDKALLIAAGTALEALETRPHLAVAIDPHMPLIRTKHRDVPLCIQGRVHPDTLQGAEGPLLYLPDSHFSFEAWLMGEETPFEAGWTVGNAATAVAALLGCNPIVFVGMDFCYREGQKYAHKKGESGELISVGDRVTQRDWLLALSWMQQFAQKNPEILFLNATAGGMRMGAPIQETRLEELTFERRKVELPWQRAPMVALDPLRLQEWRGSLKRCQLGAQRKTEVAREYLLEPLWRVWKPFVERSHVLPLSEKIQKDLFFEQVIEEHLADVREAFYEDGTLRTSELYKNGLREGGTVLFWPNGQQKRRVHFVRGRRHGTDEMWNEAGVLVDEGTYEEGRPVGVHARFFDSGQILEEIEYLEDGPVKVRHWDEQGTLLLEQQL